MREAPGEDVHGQARENADGWRAPDLEALYRAVHLLGSFELKIFFAVRELSLVENYKGVIVFSKTDMIYLLHIVTL